MREGMDDIVKQKKTYWLTSWAYLPRPFKTLWWSSSNVMSPKKIMHSMLSNDILLSDILLKKSRG